MAEKSPTVLRKGERLPFFRSICPCLQVLNFGNNILQFNVDAAFPFQTRMCIRVQQSFPVGRHGLTIVTPANTNMPTQDVFNVSCRHAAYLSTVMFLSLFSRKADAFTRQPDRENGEEPRHSRPLPLHTWQRGCSSLT